MFSGVNSRPIRQMSSTTSQQIVAPSVQLIKNSSHPPTRILGVKMPKATVIVPTYNRSDELSGMLTSLARQTCREFEVLVIDDASAKPIADQISESGWPFKLRIKRNEKNSGPGKSRNTGVLLARSDLLLFTDDDCRPDPGWVEYFILAMESAGADVGGLGGQTLAEGKDIFSRYYDFHRLLDPLPHDRNNPDYIPYLVTANCAVRKDALLHSGGFDGRIPSAGGEDVAASLRMVKSGYVLKRCPDALVYHRFRPGLRDVWKTCYRYGLGGRFVVDRYLPL